MADTVKFTDDELQEIREIQQLFNTVIRQAGSFSLKKLNSNRNNKLLKTIIAK